MLADCSLEEYECFFMRLLDTNFAGWKLVLDCLVNLIEKSLSDQRTGSRRPSNRDRGQDLVRIRIERQIDDELMMSFISENSNR